MALNVNSDTKRVKPPINGEEFTRSAIVGSSQAVVRMRQLISMVAPTSGSVLVLGPTGSGKEP
jgi:DNA-binding NtrC family response regulator